MGNNRWYLFVNDVIGSFGWGFDGGYYVIGFYSEIKNFLVL